MNRKLLRTTVVLGLMMAVAAFAIDMYLPALPAIGAELGADNGAVQLSLAAYMVALAVSQLFYGPISDRVGRKPPLQFGLALFVLGSVGAALAPSIEWLIAARFVQGFGAAAPFALPRAVVRDGYTGAEATRLMGFLMIVMSVSPILAPLAGSLVIAVADWHAVFWSMAVLALAAIVLLSFGIEETLPAHAWAANKSGNALATYGALLRDGNFVGLSLIGGFGMASFMAYLSGSSFVLIEYYGLSPSLYSVLFSSNAVSFVAMSQLAGPLARRYGMTRVVRFGALSSAAVNSVLLLLFLFGDGSLEALVALVFISSGFLGLVLPTTSVLALEDHGEVAGTAAALMGTLHIVTASVAMVAMSVFFNGTPLPMVAGIVIASLAALALTLAVIRPAREVQPA